MRLRASSAPGWTRGANDPFAAWMRFSLVFVFVLALLILLALGLGGERW